MAMNVFEREEQKFGIEAGETKTMTQCALKWEARTVQLRVPLSTMSLHQHHTYIGS
jgi:hypothetical protein